MDKYIGQMLDSRYELLEVIGVGGMAVVYKALCHRLNRLVAVKILKDEYQQDDEFRRRFQAESQAIAMLSQANIVAVYDISSGGDLDYIVMELIDGLTLKEYVTQRGEISWRESLHFSAQIAKALDHAHSRGVIHRDIKPHNIMVLKDGSVKVADFGIAQLASNRNTLTREALGSVHYISPEQARGSGTDQRTDIYSLGVVMYELLTGQLPYDGESPVSVAIQHINGGAKRPRELKPSIPEGLEEIVMKAMEPNLELRYATAAQLADDLEAFRKDPGMTFQHQLTPGGEEPTQRMSVKQVEAGIQRQKQAKPVKPKQDDEEERSRRRAQAREKNLARVQARARAAEEAKAKESQKKDHEKGPSLLAILIATMCVVLVLTGIGYFLYQYVLRDVFASTREITVPQFIGQSVYELQVEDYPDVVLTVGTYVYSDQAEGTVVAQSPEADKTVKEGNNTITLTVSLGEHTETLPELSGAAQQAAELLLQNLNLDLTVETRAEYSTDTAEGLIIRTEPIAQTTLSQGDTVTLVVSMGEEVQMVTVPTLTDYTLERAKAIIAEQGLELSHAVEVDSDLAAGIVTDQSLAAASSVREGTRITLYVSNGSGSESLSQPETQPQEETGEPETTPAQTPPETTQDPLDDEATPTQTPPEETTQVPSEPAAPADTTPAQPETVPEQPPLVAEIGGADEPEPSEATTIPATPNQPVGSGSAVDIDTPKTTLSVSIDLPAEEDVIVVTLKLDGVQAGRYAADGSDGTLTCDVSGRGIQRLDVYFDGVLTQTQTLDFSQGTA